MRSHNYWIIRLSFKLRSRDWNQLSKGKSRSRSPPLPGTIEAVACQDGDAVWAVDVFARIRCAEPRMELERA